MASQQLARDDPKLVPGRRFAATRDLQLDVEFPGEPGAFGEASSLEFAISVAALT